MAEASTYLDGSRRRTEEEVQQIKRSHTKPQPENKNLVVVLFTARFLRQLDWKSLIFFRIQEEKNIYLFGKGKWDGERLRYGTK